MRFDRLVQSLLDSKIVEYYLAIGEFPTILTEGGELVRLETKILTRDDLYGFLHWAFPESTDLVLPFESPRTFRFSHHLIDVVTTANSVTIIPRTDVR